MKINLNPKEEQVMNILWQLKKAFVKDIINGMSNPKPPYNTISSIVRKLETEGHIGHKTYGNTHQYFPILKKSQYGKWSFKKVFDKYFEGSPEALLSHFVKEEKIDPKELEAIIKKIKNTK